MLPSPVAHRDRRPAGCTRRCPGDDDRQTRRTESPFATVEEALDELRAGGMVVFVDDEYRENEGDLVMAAESVTPAAVNFIIRTPAAASASR